MTLCSQKRKFTGISISMESLIVDLQLDRLQSFHRPNVLSKPNQIKSQKQAVPKIKKRKQ